MTPARLGAELEAHARSLGIDRLRIAEARSLDSERATLEGWLAAGHHAGMGWLARTAELRTDPRRLLPGCKSVVSVAWSHAPSGGGPVARYAHGRDYHRVLGKRLRDLATWLTEISGAPARAFVDSGPVLERAWARRSGLGWIGKNGCVITRDLGSWILLGEILSAAELEPHAAPHAELCGTCTACLDACPTGAIVSDGIVDANRCISYWTIEHRGDVPEARRKGNGEWIFGCDVCQEVCPWNRRHERGTAETELEALDPETILAMDEATFRARYSGTALMRARWDGMRRNACIALGNRRDPRALPALERARSDADPLVRSHATWAIERIGRSVAEA